MITITITVPDDLPATTSKQAYLATCMAAIGYAPMVRSVGSSPSLAAPYAAKNEIDTASFGQMKVSGDLYDPRPANSGSSAATEAEANDSAMPNVMDEPAVQKAVAKRERGKPDPASGRSRRTKEEIAEDAAADAADAAKNAGGVAPSTAQISTNPEDRKPPEDEEDADDADESGTVNQAVDDAATTAQDEADEAAEQARLNAEKPAGTVTLDDLRKAMGAVGKKHGIALSAKIPGFVGVLAKIDEKDYPAKLADILALVEMDKEDVEALLTGTPAEEKTAEPAKVIKIPPGDRQQLIEAMFAYAEFADGTRDVDAMTFTMTDLPIVFKEAFGVEAQADIPDDKIGEAIRLVNETREKDRFKRKRS